MQRFASQGIGRFSVGASSSAPESWPICGRHGAGLGGFPTELSQPEEENDGLGPAAERVRPSRGCGTIAP